MWISEPLLRHPDAPLSPLLSSIIVHQAEDTLHPFCLHLLCVLSDLFKSDCQLTVIVFFPSLVLFSFSHSFIGWMRAIFRKYISTFLARMGKPPRVSSKTLRKNIFNITLEPESMFVHVWCVLGFKYKCTHDIWSITFLCRVGGSCVGAVLPFG